MSTFLTSLKPKGNTMDGYEPHEMPATNYFHLATGTMLKADFYKGKKMCETATYVGKTMLQLKARDPKTGEFYPDTFYEKDNVTVGDDGGKMETGKTILKYRERPLHNWMMFKNSPFNQTPVKIRPTQRMASYKVLLPLRTPYRPYQVKQPVDTDQVQKLSDATLDEEICQKMERNFSMETEEKQEAYENASDSMAEQSHDGHMEHLYERRGRKVLNLSSLAEQSHHELMEHLSERRGRKILNLSKLPSPNLDSYESPRGFSTPDSGVSPTMALAQSLDKFNVAAACINNVDPLIPLPPEY